MNRNEIIEKSLKDAGNIPLDNEPPFSDQPDYEEIVIAALKASLQDVEPDAEILTCDELKHLNVECCENCHTFYPHYEMCLVDLASGRKAWVCCAVKRALFSKN
jgi:ribosomal protein L31